ncbi:phage tail tape measure protein (plasmid) [Levilactobacillus suantsaii]|uniref:phage tail tape measure protein n=1 Tax=Levilactobacillus suantsaii TaxID=2292255 RepID=UPI0015F38703|nr:phage tail tape measure protein [Levilactobacillus suantsaii]QMU09316.1 phage tail tape measure protein [Levilactobacillus suantsaii]
MATVSNTMATEVKLDTVSAASSLKTLNNAIKATTNEWKANEISLKSAKDSLGAAQAKYEGLGKTMQALQAKIDRLKERQESLDTSTTKGSDKYARLSKDLANAENKMASLTAQQDRAKKSVDYYQSGLADLQTKYKSITAVSKSYVDALENQGNKAQAGRAKLNGLRESYRNLSDQLKIQQTELAKLKTSSGGASEAYNKQLIRVNQTTTSMAKQKTEIGKLAGKYGTMSSSMAKMSDGAAKARHRIANIGQAFKGAAITAASGLTSLGVATIAGAKKATNLNKVYQVNQNLLVTSGEKARKAISQVSKMQRDGAKYSIKYGVAQKEIAEQYQDLIKRGHTGAEAIAVMKSELQASVASGDDFKDVIKVSSQAIEAFGMKTNNTAKMVKNTKRVVNDLAYASDVTATDFHSLGKGMEYVGDTAKNAGFSIEQTSAAMGELSNHGMEADKAGTGLRKTITSLASPTKTAMGALKEIGIKSTKIFQDAKGNFKSLPAIFKIIEEHTKNLGGAKKADVFKRIFGQTGMQAAQTLAKYDGSLKKLTDDVTKAGEKGKYVETLAKRNSDNAKMNVERFKMAGQQLEIMIGAKLLPVITRAAQDMTKAFNNKDTQKGLTWLIGGVAKLASGFLKIIEFTSKHTKTIAAFAVAFGSVLAVSKIARFIAATTEAIGVIKDFTAVQWLLNVAMDANPIGLAVVAIGLLAAGLYEAYKHIKPFRKWVNKTAKSVVHFGKSIGKWAGHIGKSVKNGINRIGRNWNKFKSSFKKSWDKHWSAVGSKLKHSWNASVHNTKSFFGSMGSHFSSFKNSFKKSWDKHWSAVGSKLKHSWNTSVHNTKSFFGSMGSHFHSFRNRFSHSWTSHWNKMRSKLHSYWNKDLKHTKRFGTSMGHWLGAFKKSFKEGWTSLVSGVKHIFSHLWKDLKKLASNGMNDMINIINSGINLVDGVIHTFGGKKKAIGDIGHVHFATGTGVFSNQRRAITKPTMAVLNDGSDSPETGNKEAVFLPNGQSGIVQGRNTKAMLPAGTEVLNASETKLFMGMQGITHFAKGSSNWFGSLMSGIGSGIGDVSGWLIKKATGLKKFFTTAEKIIAHPIKSLDSMFNYTKSGAGVVADITKGMFHNVKKQAGNWWSSLWSMVDLDGGSAGGNWRHNPGLSETNGFGDSRSFGSHDGVDFSGPLGSAIRAVHGGTVTHVGRPLYGWPYSQLGDVITVASNDGWQEIYQEFGGMNNIKTSTGDVIKTGQKIATLGRLNGAGSGSHVHIGVSHGSLWDHGGSSTKGWYDVTKMHGKSDGSPKSSKQSGNIKGIKSQVGSGFFKFMDKLANMFSSIGGSGGASYGGASMIEKAAKAMHVNLSSGELAIIKRVIMHESGGNAKVMQKVHDINSASGHPAKGLLQFVPSTFSSYAVKGHKNILSAYDQLLAMFNDSNWRSDVHAGGWGPSGHRRYANGGISRFEKLAHISEGNKTESIVPWDITKRARAYQIMDTTMKEFAKTDKPQQSTTQSAQSTDLSELIKQGKEIIGLMAELISGQQNPVPAVVSANDIYNGYNRMDTKTKLSKNLGRGYTNGIQ